MFKWTVTTILGVLILVSISAGVSASEDDNELDDGTSSDKDTARFAFVNLNSDGSLSFTINATSIQYALLAALTALVLTAVLLPVLGLAGLPVGSEPDYGYSYTDQSGYTGASYDAPAPSYGGSSYGSSAYGKR